MGDILPGMGLPTFSEMKVAFDLFGKAIGLAKDAKDLLPGGDKKSSVEKTLDEAERASKLAEAQLAKALGYELCECTFPPQIMLRVGEEIQCPNCKRRLSESITSVKVKKDWNIFD